MINTDYIILGCGGDWSNTDLSINNEDTLNISILDTIISEN